MSGFERILARVGGDALRDYCSSAIEDELKNLKEKMQVCLTSVEKALEVQDAILKLNVPLTDNAATFAAIQSSYHKFNDDLEKFIKEQKKVQAADVARRTEEEQANTGAKRNRSRVDSAASNAGASPQEQEISRLLGMIQHRLTRKQSDWIPATINDVSSISAHLKSYAPESNQCKDLVLVLDHFISAVLLSSMVTDSVLSQLFAMLSDLVGAHDDIDEYIRSARELLASKRSAFAPPQHSNYGQHMATHAAPAQHQSTPNGIHMVDPQHFNNRNSAIVSEESPRHKKPKIEHNAVDLIVKVEKAAAAAAQLNAQHAGAYEVHVYDLPWGAMQTDVEAYFSGAGTISSIRMPTMEDGSTVGVAIIRFAAYESMNTALRMDGNHFQGKSIRVTVPAKPS